jgi:hypothetical protein
MTHRTENNRVFDSKKIMIIAKGCIIFNYAYVIIGLVLARILEIPGAIAKCSGDNIKGFPLFMVINNVYHIILIFIGISGDLLLNKFMKEKRNRGGEVRLVAWKVPRTSSESNQDDNYKTNVPIYATLIGTLGTAACTVASICIFQYYEKGLPYGIFVLGSAFYMPLVLTLTIKHHRKKSNRVASMIPMTLQFHQDNDNFLEGNQETENPGIAAGECSNHI